MSVRADRDHVRLLPTGGQDLVAQHRRNRDQVAVLFMPAPDPVVYIVPLSHILGRLPLLPAGNYGTIPRSMSLRKDACFPRGACDRAGRPGSGSPLFYINTWAMIWPTDYPALAGAAL